MLGEVLSLVPFAAITVKCISSVSDGLAGMTVSINPLSASQCVPSLLWTKGLTSSCPCMGISCCSAYVSSPKSRPSHVFPLMEGSVSTLHLARWPPSLVFNSTLMHQSYPKINNP